jgi:hypothetical protein
MSNALAIAAVTATLQQQLAAAASASGVAGAQVTTLRPGSPSGLPTPGVNLFLYQVSPNAAWRNADLPTRGADGTLLRQPRVALDLHYLLTFYGDDATLDQQRLLGAVARQFHAAPVLARGAVANAQRSFTFLASSNLADQPELVRVTPAHLSLEELSKLWSIFPDVEYVLSAVYVAGVVLIETDDTPPAPAPAPRRPAVTASAGGPAVIDVVEPQPVELSLSPPTALTLVGRNLDPASDVTFTTPGQPVPLAGAVGPGPGGGQLTVLLPDGLRPGVNTVRLTQRAPPASPPFGPRVLSESNAAAFVLRPTLRSIALSSPPGQLVAVVYPAPGPRQQVTLLLNTLGGVTFALPPAPPAPPQQAGPNTFYFNTTTRSGPLPPGTYLVRVRVDDADSRLDVGASGRFTGPTVTIG